MVELHGIPHFVVGSLLGKDVLYLNTSFYMGNLCCGATLYATCDVDDKRAVRGLKTGG
jgi:hypothetical protein